MHQRDMERFAFLFLCGKHDRGILLGKEKMTFSDLDRLTYITDFLGLKLYNLEIWNTYSGQFAEQFQRLEQLYDETSSIVSWDPTEADEHLHDRWIWDFCGQVPDRKSRKQLKAQNSYILQFYQLVVRFLRKKTSMILSFVSELFALFQQQKLHHISGRRCKPFFTQHSITFHCFHAL